MDIHFIGDQLDNFSDFVGGLLNVFGGFAKVFDNIAGAAVAGDKFEVKPDTTFLDGLSSKK